MLGRVRRTTRTDVGLALAATGLAYLLWIIVTGVARYVVNQLVLIRGAAGLGGLAGALSASFIHGAAIWDLVGALWMLLSLALIVGSSRQRWIISWPWLSAILHAMVAGLLAGWTSLAAIGPFAAAFEPAREPAIGWGSYSFFLAIGLVMWVITLVWLLYERRRRRGPSLIDGQRTHRP